MGVLSGPKVVPARVALKLRCAVMFCGQDCFEMVVKVLDASQYKKFGSRPAAS